MNRIPAIAFVLIGACAVALGCTISRTERPNLTGPSELGLSLSLYANPDIVVQNGVATSQIVVQARDAAGQAVKSLPLRFDLGVNPAGGPTGTLSSASATTDSDGRASVTYTAPASATPAVATIAATPTGSDFANAVPRTVTIRLVVP